MRKLLQLVLPVLSVLLAITLSSGFGTVRDDDWPPQRFRAVGMVIVLYGSQSLIDKECGKAPRGFVTEGCSNGERIVLPDPCKFPKDDDFARITCHELSHELGNWPETHPK